MTAIRPMPFTAGGAGEGGRGVVRAWVPPVAAAEFLGFGIPAFAGTMAALADLPPVAFLLVMVAAGAGEGALLGAGQVAAFRRLLPGVPARPWIVATAGAAAFAWSIGMLPSTLGDLGAPVWVSIAVFAVGAPFLLASIPVAQAVVLGRVVPAARWRWAWVTAAAWAAGLPATAAPTPFVDESTPAAVLFAVFVAAGAVMAVVMAVVTGVGLRALLRSASPAP